VKDGKADDVIRQPEQIKAFFLVPALQDAKLSLLNHHICYANRNAGTRKTLQ
jgi:hypothetical protein